MVKRKKEKGPNRAFFSGVLRLTIHARVRYFFLAFAAGFAAAFFAGAFFAGAFFLAFAAGLLTFFAAAFFAGAFFFAVAIVTSSVKVVGTPVNWNDIIL
jgi:hypothetical protein